MELQQYPQAIAETKLKALFLDGKIQGLQETISLRNCEIDVAIAFDESLKNEAQRKAARAGMTQDQSYLELQMELRELQVEREKLRIEAERLQNMFSVLKLEVQSS